MLLRRITGHFQAQNWFAVLVDFFIVVVGVFVGLQVQDWNDARKERIEEQVLLSRLHSEVSYLLTTLQAELETLRLQGEILVGVNPVLFSQEPSRLLTEAECRHVAGSHVNRRPPDEIPVLDEMLGSGRFDLIRDPEVRNNLRSYVLLRERARSHYSESINELFRLHSRFPSLISLTRVPRTDDSVPNWGGLSGEGFRWQPECDVDAMRANTAFLNEYVDNVGRRNSLTGFVKQRHDLLVELERILADSVAIRESVD